MAFIDELKNARTDEHIEYINKECIQFAERVIEAQLDEDIRLLKKDILERVRRGEKGTLMGKLILGSRGEILPKVLESSMRSYRVEFPKIMDGITYTGKYLTTKWFDWDCFKKKKFLFRRKCVRIYLTDLGRYAFVKLQKKLLAEGFSINFAESKVIATFSVDGDEYGYYDKRKTVGCFTGIDWCAEIMKGRPAYIFHLRGRKSVELEMCCEITV